MACYYPIGIHDLKGKPVRVPCGRCIGCRLEISRQWAVRCMHEAQMYEKNCFITLTYNDGNLPQGGSLLKSDFVNFIRRLRNEKGSLRYFGCGEYGENFGRPHYHSIIFGVDFEDKEEVEPKRFLKWKKRKYAKKTKSGLYRSPVLEKIWQKGFSTIGEVEFESAAYVARYVMKKVTGEKQEEHYQGKVPEFALMSRMPGIGRIWIEKYLSDVYPKDYYHLNGVRQRPTRYYDSVAEKLKPKMFAEVKKKRKEKQEETEHDPHELWLKDKFRKNVTKQLKRRLEDA